MLTATVAAIGFGCKIEPVKTGGTVIDISGKTIGKKAVNAGTAAIRSGRPNGFFINT